MRAVAWVASVASALAATPALAVPQQQDHSKRFDDYSIHTERSLIPPDWALRSLPEHASPAHDRREAAGFDDLVIPVRINLIQNNIDEAHGRLMDISHPESSNYGQHLTPEEVAELFAPSDESVDDVLAWLIDAGHSVSREDNYDHFKGAITVKMPVSHAEDLLRTTYEIYEHGPSGTPHVACTSYSVPSPIAHHIDFITPTTDFDIHVPNTRNAKRDGSSGTSTGPKFVADIDITTHDAVGTSKCDQAITPACLRALYGIDYTPTKNMPNGFGVVEYTPASYNPEDLDMFFEKHAPALVGKRPANRSIDGGVLDTTHKTLNINGESDLDLEYAMALVGQHQIVSLYQTGDTVIGGSHNTFLDALDSSYCAGNDPSYDPTYPDTKPGGYKGNSCGVYKNELPKVVSTSYSYDEFGLTLAYKKRQCNEYLKLGLLGVTFVFSSGDNGVAGNGDKCIDAKTGEVTKSGTRFNPSYPGTCPYVLAVGATEVYPGKKVTDPEGASNEVIYSGGGFSNHFPLPTYQSTAVKKYFAQHKPSFTGSQYDNTMKTRGYPDISANGAKYVVAAASKFTKLYGTSASAPVVASMIALINNARHAKGKKPVGFINPALYAHPELFHDITYGRNPGCGTKGFEAVSGWDPVTGLGTPRFKKLMTYFSNLP
ncbi:subtilisin-like protein [Clavulina sp. PMI_390]|nr:subtilisin-like protein [Clavulina sp. PMI_390]